MENKIIISGPCCAGKTTIANNISKKYGIPIISIREYYKNYLVPRYLEENGLGSAPFTRELTMEAANWVYKDDPAGFIKMFLQDIELPSACIIESLRIKADIEHLLEKIDAKIIFIDADEKTRLKRCRCHELMQCKTEEEVLKSMRYEISQYGIEQTKKLAIEIGLVVDTSGHYNENIPPYVINKIHEFIEH